MSPPLERMIDRALGVPEGWISPRIELRCPRCGKTGSDERTAREQRIASGVYLILTCPDCAASQKEIEARYSDGTPYVAGK